MSNEATRDYKALLKESFVSLKKAQDKLTAIEQGSREPIAIIGIGCRFPGQSDNPQAFWQLLLERGDAISEVPADRWDVDAFYDPDPAARGKISSRWGGFLR